VSGVAFTPLGGCLGFLQTGQGGLLCPMLARVATVGQENPCRAGPAYLCLRQVLRPGQGHQLDRVGMGGAWAGLWVAVSPHKGHKGHKPAAGKPQGPQASCRETLASHKPARGKRWPAGGSWWGPGPAVVSAAG
jgi:hypothetical protein